MAMCWHVSMQTCYKTCMKNKTIGYEITDSLPYYNVYSVMKKQTN